MIKQWILPLALLVFVPHLALAQGQNAHSTGTFTPGHLLRSNTASGSPYSDGGGAAGATSRNSGYITEIGITNTGIPFCINDALIGDPSGYNAVCMGHDTDGNPALTINSYGGKADKDLHVILNGTDYIWPGTGVGNVVGPNSVTNCDIAVYNGTGGNLINATQGQVCANQYGLTLGYGIGATPQGKFQVRNSYTGNATSPNAGFFLHDYKPAGGGTFPTNPSGVYGDLWLDAPGTFQGLPTAIRANGYTIAQITATIVAPGSGYLNGEIVDLDPGNTGTCNEQLDTPPQFQLTVVNGVVTAATFVPGFGACTVYPANPASVTGGSGTGLTLDLAHGQINSTYLSGSYGRARHTAKGNITYLVAQFADGCYNAGGGTVGNCVGVFLEPPYPGANPTFSYGLWVAGGFTDGVIASALGVDINFIPGAGGIVSTTSALLAGVGQPCRANVQGGSNAAFGAFGADCYVLINSQGTGQVTIQQGGNPVATFLAGASGVNYLGVIGSATGINPLIQVLSSADTNVDFQLRSLGTGMVRLQGGGGTDLLKAGPIGGAGTTSMLLLVNNASGVSMQAVSLGAADSGGAGYKALRVLN